MKIKPLRSRVLASSCEIGARTTESGIHLFDDDGKEWDTENEGGEHEVELSHDPDRNPAAYHGKIPVLRDVGEGVLGPGRCARKENNQTESDGRQCRRRAETIS